MSLIIEKLRKMFVQTITICIEVTCYFCVYLVFQVTQMMTTEIKTLSFFTFTA